MKNKLFVLALALMLALPVFGLAAELTTVPDAETPQTVATPVGGQFGRRLNQETPAAAIAPRTGFADADEDGVCDNCGQTQGQNPAGPGFVDEDKDGVCDHYGTDEAGQGRVNAGQNRGNATSRGAQGKNQGDSYVDANNDGACDNLNTAGVQQGKSRNAKPGNQRNAAPGRGRR